MATLTCYIDCVSPYSWFAFANLIRSRPLLNTHGVAVTLVPFFLGAARDGNGNPYVRAPDVKAKWSQKDTEVTGKLLGLTCKPPKVFPISSMLAVRLATVVKEYAPEMFEVTMNALWAGFHTNGFDISTPKGLEQSLSSFYSHAELEHLLKEAVTPENKKRVIENTQEAMKTGAFGAPWIVTTNKKGETRAFFGNDRWDHIYEFLGLPYQPVTLLPPKTSNSRL